MEDVDLLYSPPKIAQACYVMQKKKKKSVILECSVNVKLGFLLHFVSDLSLKCVTQESVFVFRPLEELPHPSFMASCWLCTCCTMTCKWLVPACDTGFVTSTLGMGCVINKNAVFTKK